MAKIVIALGGNAIIKKNEKPTIKNLLKNIKKALKSLFSLIKRNDTVLTHGSGPSVGYLLLQNELAKKKVPVKPLNILDAEIEGQIGYLIQQELGNLFAKKKVKREVVTILTRVLVNEGDSAFHKPSKFVGPFYKTKPNSKYDFKEDPRGGWRRVVASPKPIKIIEDKIVKDLLEKNTVVIAVGGGGIPVIKIKHKEKLKGVEAVVDKDLASVVLANSLGAEELIMITDVPGVYLNYKKKSRKLLGKIKLRDLKKYKQQGHFSGGGMGPKIEAVIEFFQKNRKAKKATITNTESIGKGGTVIVK